MLSHLKYLFSLLLKQSSIYHGSHFSSLILQLFEVLIECKVKRDNQMVGLNVFMFSWLTKREIRTGEEIRPYVNNNCIAPSSFDWKVNPNCYFLIKYLTFRFLCKNCLLVGRWSWLQEVQLKKVLTRLFVVLLLKLKSRISFCLVKVSRSNAIKKRPIYLN